MNTHLTFGRPKKSIEDLWFTPSRRFKVDKYYYIEKNAFYRDRNYLWGNGKYLRRPTVSFETVRYIQDEALRNDDYPFPYPTHHASYNYSLDEMDTILATLQNQHPDHQFSYDETQVDIQRYGKHGREIDENNNIYVNYPRQAFGTAIYNQFRQLKLNYINRQKEA
jgi:hypothetical protein